MVWEVVQDPEDAVYTTLKTPVAVYPWVKVAPFENTLASTGLPSPQLMVRLETPVDSSRKLMVKVVVMLFLQFLKLTATVPLLTSISLMLGASFTLIDVVVEPTHFVVLSVAVSFTV